MTPSRSKPRCAAAPSVVFAERVLTTGLSPQLTIIPLPYANTPLLFTLTLTPSLPSALPLLTGPDGSPNVKILAVAVSRKVTTNPVRDPGMGQADFQWAGVRIAPAQLAGEGRLERSGGGWEVQGKVEVPSGECTVDSRGVKIAVSRPPRLSAHDRVELTPSLPLAHACSTLWDVRSARLFLRNFSSSHSPCSSPLRRRSCRAAAAMGQA